MVFPESSLPAEGAAFDASGDLVRTTINGGHYGNGAVFEIPSGTTTITTVASFNGTNGKDAQTGVTFDAAGNLYGLARQGGQSGFGDVFQIPSGSSTLTLVASLYDGEAGSFDDFAGVTLDALGNIYGVTQQAGAANNGVVFEVARGSSARTTVASFDGDNGSGPYAGLARDAAGNLYGTT